MHDLRHANRVGDRRLRQPGNGDNVAGASLFDTGAFKTTKGKHLCHTTGLDELAVPIDHLDDLVRANGAGSDTSGDDAAEVGVCLENGSQHPELSLLDPGRRDVPDHEIEQCGHAPIFRALGRSRHPTLLGGAIQDRKIELLLGCIKGGKQIEDLVDDRGRPRIRAVHLVDDDNGPQPDLESLGYNELGLR